MVCTQECPLVTPRDTMRRCGPVIFGRCKPLSTLCAGHTYTPPPLPSPIRLCSAPPSSTGNPPPSSGGGLYPRDGFVDFVKCPRGRKSPPRSKPARPVGQLVFPYREIDEDQKIVFADRGSPTAKFHVVPVHQASVCTLCSVVRCWFVLALCNVFVGAIHFQIAINLYTA